LTPITHITDDLDHRLHRVGAHDRLEQRAGDTEASDGEGLGEAFSQAGGGVGGHPLELAGECFEGGLGLVGVGLRPRASQLAAHPGPLGFGQMVEHILGLMNSTPGDHGVVAEHVAHGAGEGLAAIEDEQHALAGVQAAVSQPR
jgi:hypothetical protein